MGCLDPSSNELISASACLDEAYHPEMLDKHWLFFGEWYVVEFEVFHENIIINEVLER